MPIPGATLPPNWTTMRPRNCLIFTFGLVEMERIVFGNKPPTVLSHVLRLALAGNTVAGATDVLRWWISHLNSFENVFTVLVLPRSDGDHSEIHPWCDLTTQTLDKNYKICILSLPLGSIGLALDLFSRIWMESHLNIFVRIPTNIFSWHENIKGS